MKSIEDFVRQIKVLESVEREKQKVEEKIEKKRKDYLLQKKNEDITNEMRKINDKLILWNDIKEWRDKIIEIPEVRQFLDDRIYFSVCLYEDCSNPADVLSIKMYCYSKEFGNFYYASNCYRFINKLNYSFLLDDNTIEKVPFKILKGLYEHIQSGEVYKEMLKQRRVIDKNNPLSVSGWPWTTERKKWVNG